MPRGRPIRSATLPALLLLAVAAVAALGFLDARDLVHRSWTEPTTGYAVALAPEILTFETPAIGSPAGGPLKVYSFREPAAVQFSLRPAATTRHGGLFGSGPGGARVGWLLGTSLPGTLVALGVLALIGATVGLALRRGGYSPAVLRLLRAVGFAALVGGPVAALVEYLVGRGYPELTWTPPVDRWVLALVWVLVGGAFLAVNEVVGRAAALRAELDGVI